MKKKTQIDIKHLYWLHVIFQVAVSKILLILESYQPVALYTHVYTHTYTK